MANYVNLKNAFMNYVAPTLCGIKPSNLFTVAKSDFSKSYIRLVQENLKNFGLSLKILDCSNNRKMIFVYDSYWINEILSSDFVQKYFSEKGYKNAESPLACLEELFFRVENQKNFPHEIGLVLGYPFEDVIGFEKNEGRNCKFCDCWKCYSDADKAKICCDLYKDCCKLCTKWYEEGLSVSQIIKKYKEAVKNAA